MSPLSFVPIFVMGGAYRERLGGSTLDGRGRDLCSRSQSDMCVPLRDRGRMKTHLLAVGATL
jgi:hypothetical protein